MRGNLGDLARVQHIYDAIQEIESYTSSVDFESFYNNSMMVYACIKQLEIIGEASNHLTDDLKAKHTSEEWRHNFGMSNNFFQEYYFVE